MKSRKFTTYNIKKIAGKSFFFNARFCQYKNKAWHKKSLANDMIDILMQEAWIKFYSNIVLFNFGKNNVFVGQLDFIWGLIS